MLVNESCAAPSESGGEADAGNAPYVEDASPRPQDGVDDAKGPETGTALLSPKQEAAIAALIGEPSYAVAAQAAGVTDRTLRRWLQTDPAFRQRLRQARASAFEGVVRKLHSAGSEAAGILEAIARDANASLGARVAAARTLLHFSCRGREVADLDDRMAELEEQLERFGNFVNEKSSWRRK